MHKIIFITYLSIILSYINCSECSENKNSTDDETCSKLRVEDEMTQVCIKKSSEGKGCKETNICTEVLSRANDEICSKLNVSPDKNNTHICINSPSMNISKCISLLKRKYDLDEEEELIFLKDDGPLIEKLENKNYFLYQQNFLIFSISLGAFLPIEACLNEDEFPSKCIEESECTKVKYVNSDVKCSKLSVSKINMYTHICIKNPEEGATDCIESNICSHVKFGGTHEKCANLTSTEGTICIKDPLGEGCKETDICNEVKYIISKDKCKSLKLSNNSYIKSCIEHSNGNGCFEQPFNCEEISSNASDEICNKLETNDSQKKCIKNKNGNNCMLINYCNYIELKDNEDCGEFPVENETNICIKKENQNKCEEVKNVTETIQNEEKEEKEDENIQNEENEYNFIKNEEYEIENIHNK